MFSSVVKLKRKLAYRVYLATMRFEAMAWLRFRRILLNIITGRRSSKLNVFSHVFIDGAENLFLGQSISFNRDCHISAAGGLTIGDKVSIGHATTILTTEHGFRDRGSPIQEQPVLSSPVVIGANVWIGARVVILAGVTLAEGTIVGAGAVVTRSIEEPYCTIAGVPARTIAKRELSCHDSAVPSEH